MRKEQAEIGQTYAVKVSGKIQPVKLTSINLYGGWNGVNTKTNRVIRVRTAAKLRYTLKEV